MKLQKILIKYRKFQRRKLEIKEQSYNDSVYEEKFLFFLTTIKFLADKGTNGEDILIENKLSKYKEYRYRSIALNEPDIISMEL